MQLFAPHSAYEPESNSTSAGQMLVKALQSVPSTRQLTLKPTHVTANPVTVCKQAGPSPFKTSLIKLMQFFWNRQDLIMASTFPVPCTL